MFKHMFLVLYYVVLTSVEWYKPPYSNPEINTASNVHNCHYVSKELIQLIVSKLTLFAKACGVMEYK